MRHPIKNLYKSKKDKKKIENFFKADNEYIITIILCAKD